MSRNNIRSHLNPYFGITVIHAFNDPTEGSLDNSGRDFDRSIGINVSAIFSEAAVPMDDGNCEVAYE